VAHHAADRQARSDDIAEAVAAAGARNVDGRGEEDGISGKLALERRDLVVKPTLTSWKQMTSGSAMRFASRAMRAGSTFPSTPRHHWMFQVRSLTRLA
jgi:hypothetical protein